MTPQRIHQIIEAADAGLKCLVRVPTEQHAAALACFDLWPNIEVRASDTISGKSGTIIMDDIS